MFLVEIYKGLRSVIAAHGFIAKHRLWGYLVIPGILSLIYVSALIATGVVWLDELTAYIGSRWVPGFLQGQAMSVITTILLWVLLLVLAALAYKHVILAVFSPVLGYLSELSERKLTGAAAPEFSVAQVFRDLSRALILNVRNLLLTILLSVFAWLLVLIPLLGPPVSATLLFLIQAYYGGVGLADYTLERHRYSVRESIKFTRKHRWRMTGVGAGFLGLLFVPIVGWFAAPAFGAVAATLTTLELMQEAAPE